MYKISFYVPEDYLEQVKNALFQKGAGEIGNYTCCAWQVKGQGQFMPLVKSNPFIGKINQLETVAEYKVEMICKTDLIHSVIAEFKRVHPYETPAYEVIRLEDF